MLCVDQWDKWSFAIPTVANHNEKDQTVLDLAIYASDHAVSNLNTISVKIISSAYCIYILLNENDGVQYSRSSERNGVCIFRL